MSKKRKKHSIQFKAKVALAALANGETTAHFDRSFDVHPTMTSTWKRQLFDSAAELFDKSHKLPKPHSSRLHPEHRIYPYLLRGLTNDHPN